MCPMSTQKSSGHSLYTISQQITPVVWVAWLYWSSCLFLQGVDYFGPTQDHNNLREFTTSSKTMKEFFQKAVLKTQAKLAELS